MTDPNMIAANGAYLSQNIPLFAAACALLLLLLGGLGVLLQRDNSLLRMRAVAGNSGGTSGFRLTKSRSDAPRGLAKALIPDDPSELAQIQFQLNKVGFTHVNAVQHFFVMRLVMAILPLVLVFGAVALARAGLLPVSARDAVLGFPPLGLMQIAAVGTAIGFYGPSYLLRTQIKARQARVRNGFPNALDLLQISVEAGLGFDAALARVGTELSRVSPEIAYEFLTLLNEVNAGRDRETAMFDMAERMGIDEAKSFVLVVVQSMQFGTSLTKSLRAYAIEMRENRELSAQEKANKLPVQMSAVMSLLMLPALFLITLTPIIIRYSAIY
ncbi:type II secretion system F family protein [Puniceibacterium confluentis]|uniref:type II secretion system F family protein n=1 Tax=Puniceibacterium confluentis TaxID=1958944 RepID=UPI001C981531|nr:type II secretion system F family protein [Puniceibacterium confluentis]